MILSVNETTAVVRLYRGAPVDEQLHAYSYWSFSEYEATNYANKCNGAVHTVEVELPVSKIYKDYWGDGKDAVVLALNHFYVLSHNGRAWGEVQDQWVLAMQGMYERPNRDGDLHYPITVGESYSQLPINMMMGTEWFKNSRRY